MARVLFTALSPEEDRSHQDPGEQLPHASLRRQRVSYWSELENDRDLVPKKGEAPGVGSEGGWDGGSSFGSEDLGRWGKRWEDLEVKLLNVDKSKTNQ